MKTRINCKSKNEKGEAMLITTILILIMLVIAGTCMSVAGIQWDMAYTQKTTSNTYYIAKSGAEKGVDMINKALQAQMPIFIEEIRADYFKPLTEISDVRNAGLNVDFYYLADTAENKNNRKLKYTEGKFVLDEKIVANLLKDKIYTFIESNYFNKEVNYEVQTDGQISLGTIQVSIEFKALSSGDKGSFKIISTARIGKNADIKDIKMAESVVEIKVPEQIKNEIHEAYNWLYNPSEILDSAITCFSDVVVTDGAKLTVIGDMRVKGTGKQTTTQAQGSEVVLLVPDMNEIGGVIASNGGQIKVESPSATSSEDNYSTNSGSIYCINNVATTHGWEPEDPSDPHSSSLVSNYTKTPAASITAAGDIIANTLAIYDDFYIGGYNQLAYGGMTLVKGNNIQVSENVFVDNDVTIDKYVTDSSIDVRGSIFGISDGTLDSLIKLKIKNSEGNIQELEAKDPNSSSGIFNRSGGSRISAGGMFVNGQPFILLDQGLWYNLWESIGEPFEAVRTFYDLTGFSLEGTPNYLTSEVFKDEVKKDRIQITVPGNHYTPPDTYISAKFGLGSTGETKKSYSNILQDQVHAKAFFYQGASEGINPPSITSAPIVINNAKYSKSSYFQSIDNYFDGAKELDIMSDMYFKNYLMSPEGHKYKGLRGYMTAKRSVFYGYFDTVLKQLGVLNYDQVVDMRKISKSEYSWTYETPIIITNGGTIQLKDYYIKEGTEEKPYPTIIINRSENLVLQGGLEGDTQSFKGIIISEGNIELKGHIRIEGAVIIGGRSPLSDATREDGGIGLRARDKLMLGKEVGLSIAGDGTNDSVNTDVTIIHDPDMLFKIKAADKKLYREVLDALKITQFNKSHVAEILGPYSDEALQYTQGRVKLSNHSILDITTEDIRVKIKTMKKINS